MNLMNKKSLNEHSIWDRIEARAREFLYTVMYELIQCDVVSPFIYKFLVLIEAIQLLYFSIHPYLYFLWDTVFFQYIKTIVQYFQINFILTMGTYSMFIIILYIAITVLFLMLLLITISSYQIVYAHRKISSFLAYMIQIISSFAVLINTVLFIPFFNVLFAAIYCDSRASIHFQTTCYQGIYFLHLTVN